MPLDNTLTIVCVSAVVAIAAYAVYKYQQNRPMMVYKQSPKDHYHSSLNNDAPYMPSGKSVYFKTVEESNGLPIACVSTLGGDIMMCPSSGVCPLNGQRCQPQADNKPCCTDRYYPWQTTYSTV